MLYVRVSPQFGWKVGEVWESDSVSPVTHVSSVQSREPWIQDLGAPLQPGTTENDEFLAKHNVQFTALNYSVLESCAFPGGRNPLAEWSPEWRWAGEICR